MNRLIIGFSGREGSGKTTAATFTLSEFLNIKIGQRRFVVGKSGKNLFLIDTFNANKIIQTEFPNSELTKLEDTYGVKLYRFDYPIKSFCMSGFGFTEPECYIDGDSDTHIYWDNLFEEVREKFSRPTRGTGVMKPAEGSMTVNQVISVLKNDIINRLDENFLSRSLYYTIESEGYDLAIIDDAYLPNQITMGTEKGGKMVRLLKSPKHPISDWALDVFPLGEFSLVIDNESKTIGEMQIELRKNIITWFDDKRL